MRIFIQASEFKLWTMIVNGPHTPSKLINNVSIPKPESEWDEYDERMAQLNATAMNLLYCALSASEFNRIFTCISVKEIWDRLEVTHEGTNQVKESKTSMLVQKYEMFQMEQNETIISLFTRFTDITSCLKNFGRMYSNSNNVKKILQSLPRA